MCFNRLIDENTDFLYRRLSDRDNSVKKTGLMTLTFLILAGHVKVKGQLGEMAKCLEDEDWRIADLAKIFFMELCTKDNAIYNGFTNIFSLLSTDKNPLGEDSLKRIVKPLRRLSRRYVPCRSGDLIGHGETCEVAGRETGVSSSSLRDGKTMQWCYLHVIVAST